jgi:hypothetical protein
LPLVHAGIPEPGYVFYGRVTNTDNNSAISGVSVQWTIEGGSNSLPIAAEYIQINNMAFYIAHVPFETRRIGSGTNEITLSSTAGTFELPPTATQYQRSVLIDGKDGTIMFPTGDNPNQFTFSRADRGKLERVDISVSFGLDDFNAWSLEVFGEIVGPQADWDDDGSSNFTEWQAGTDPQDPDSFLAITNFLPRAGGGFEFTLQSVEGREYTVEYSTTMESGSWSVVAVTPVDLGDGLLKYILMPGSASGPRFYRVTVIISDTAP